MIKNLLVVLALVLSVSAAKASHLAGGEIWYEYVGDSLNPYKYKIYLRLYRELNKATLGTSAQICIKSSCFSSQNYWAQLIPIYDSVAPLDTIQGSVPGSILTPDLLDCVDTNASGLVFSEVYLYSVTVNLPGKCQDFNFSYSTCCRNNNDNIITGSSHYFYIDAGLNNLNGPNSSPQFINPAVKSLCVGSDLRWVQTAIEPNGDSLFYHFAAPQDANCGGTRTLITYKPGYSYDQPISTQNGILFDHATGIFTGKLTQPEIDALKIIVEEYRFDSTLSVYTKIGYSSVDIEIVVVGSCGPIQTNWLSSDTTSIGPGNTFSCGDSIIRLVSTKRFDVSTLALDGSDFALHNSQGTVIPIIAAGVDNPGYLGLVSKSFWLKLHKPLWYNDTLILVSRLGNDLNTLYNTCGLQLHEGDSIQYIVSSCATKIGLTESALSESIKVYPNPANEVLNLEINENSRGSMAVVYNLNGQKLWSRKLNSLQTLIPIQHLPNGIYILKIKGASETEVVKFEKR